MTAPFPDMTEAALEYLRQGYAVMPGWSPYLINKQGKAELFGKPVYCSSKAPLRGRFFSRPITTEEEARRWFGRFPRANLLIATGRASGIAVLDVDHYTNDHLRVAGLDLPETRRVASGLGEHYYYRLPPGLPPLPTLRNAMPGEVTLLAEQGCVIAPPSLHVSGKRYRWINPDTPISPLPEWMHAHLQHQKPHSPLLNQWRYYWKKRLLYILALQLKALFERSPWRARSESVPENTGVSADREDK